MTLNRAGLRSKPSDSPEKALQLALRFLGYRPRSEAEVRSHLARRGCSTAVAARTLEKLRSLAYVNDENFARNWALSRAESRGYGPKRIAQELNAKGIGHSLIREILRETFAQGHEAQKARTLLKRRFKNQKLDDPKILLRAAAFLQRRGYSSEVVSDLLKQPVED